MIQKLIKNSWLAVLLTAIICLSACSDDESPSTNVDDPTEPVDVTEFVISAGDNAADSAQLAFIEVESGMTITFGEGTFDFTNTLSMDGKSNVVIRGAGRDKTFLNFSGQTAGGDGVLITNTDSVRIEDITIIDAAGDALKTRECNKVSFVNVGTVWSGEPSTENGAYGLYPVLCSEVYIDGCYAYGASDAGIYVGQSDLVIVKNSVAEGNVAGIEIENTTNADVFDNEAFDNTGGVLVFDLPGLTQYGSTVRVYDNNIHDNNRLNFAPAGNVVGNVPAGTGVMILSTKNVEVFDNTLSENTFAGVIVANYLIIDGAPEDENYDPYPAGIYIHDNDHTMTQSPTTIQPALIQELMTILLANGYELPNILMDGLLNNPDDVCIQEAEGTSFVNMNLWAYPDLELLAQVITTDMSGQLCTKDALPAVDFDEF